MFCPNCGKQIPDGLAFCSECGASLKDTAQQPVYDQQPAYQQPVQAAPEVNTSPAMVLSIVALALAELGIPGLILAIIARKKVKACQAAGAPLAGKLKVANILSRVALILSIVMIVFWFIYGIVIGAAFAAAGASGVDWSSVFSDLY